MQNLNTKVAKSSIQIPVNNIFLYFKKSVLQISRLTYYNIEIYEMYFARLEIISSGLHKNKIWNYFDIFYNKTQ